MTDPHDDLRALLAAVADESVTPEQVARLEHLLRTDPAAEALYVQYMSLHADLVTHFAPPATPSLPAPRRRAIPRVGWKTLAGLAAAALLAVALWPRPGESPGAVEDTDAGVATLAQAVAAEWDDTGLPTRVGAPLPPGRLVLRAGLAQVEFYSGATVVLEGPAELLLVSPKEAVCRRGKLRTLVPPSAQGFVVRTPARDLVDRGTEFAVRVGDGGASEVHVLQGKVEAYPPGAADRGPGQEVTAGAGVRWDAAGAPTAIPADGPGFVSPADLAGRASAEAKGRQDRWQAASAAVRADPSVLAYFAFDPDRPWDRTLPDRGPGGHDGAVVGSPWVSGRWPGKRGLEFKSVGDRVRFRVPGEFDSLTFAAWVRVDGTERTFNSLVMTDGWDPGEAHWQIRNTGAVVLGVRGPGALARDYVSPPVFTPDRLGQWVHLAAVFDGPGRAVTHFVDGRAASAEPVRFETKLRVGDAEVGNWNPGPRDDARPVRAFNGRIDEVTLYRRPLSADDVRAVFDAGRPGG